MPIRSGACTIAAAMPLPAGAIFGQYVIRSLLGSGGMGEVYLARDTKLDRDDLTASDRGGELNGRQIGRLASS